MSCFEQTTIIIGLVISFFVAVGTGGLAAFSFIQVQRVKRDYELRQLNDILTWANIITSWKYSENVIGVSLHATQEWFNLATRLSYDRESLLSILRQGRIMSNVALIFKKRPLNALVKELCKEISVTQEKLTLAINTIPTGSNVIIQGTPPQYEAAITAVKEQEIKQDLLADKLIDVISELISNY